MDRLSSEAQLNGGVLGPPVAVVLNDFLGCHASKFTIALAIRQ